MGFSFRGLLDVVALSSLVVIVLQINRKDKVNQDAESGRMVESENISPQQPPQAHTVVPVCSLHRQVSDIPRCVLDGRQLYYRNTGILWQLLIIGISAPLQATAKYGKIWYDEDVHDLRSVETEFPAIAFNDNLTSNERLSCEPTVSSLNNNEIDFRISFDESDDEDYTVVFDKNSFSYKIIFANDLKTNSENDNEKVNMPLFPSPEPSVSCIDDLYFIKDFENEFLASVYNDALTSKSDFSTEPTLCPQYINEFDLKDETSLFEYDEVEQNILYFNDLITFIIIYLDDLKLDKDNHDNEIDMIQYSGGINTTYPGVMVQDLAE
ncbi:hypothetical protein Tco_0477189 [Tanacetum coccineum]